MITITRAIALSAMAGMMSFAAVAQTPKSDATRPSGTPRAGEKDRSVNTVDPTDHQELPKWMEDKKFGKFTELWKASEMDKEFKDDQPYTIFAPTDEAFTKMMPQAEYDALRNDKSKLTVFMRDHVVRGRYTYADLEKVGKVRGLAEHEYTITRTEKGLRIQESIIGKPELVFSRGVLYQLDAPLIYKTTTIEASKIKLGQPKTEKSTTGTKNKNG